MCTVTFSKEMCEQFIMDCYDQLLLDTLAQEEQKSGTDEQSREERRVAA